MSEASQKAWKYIFPGDGGKPLRGTILAETREDAEKRLKSMAIPGAALEVDVGTRATPSPTSDVDSAKGANQDPGQAETQRESPPPLSVNPVRVLDQISKSAQMMIESRRGMALDIEADLGRTRPPIEPRRKTRERIFFGEPEKTIFVADKLLAEQNGTVTHFSTAIDPKGKLLVAIVVRHEVEENEKKT